MAWQSFFQDGAFFGVFAQRFASDGSSSGPEFRVNTYTTGHQEFPAVAVADDGSFLVAWSSDTGFEEAQRYASGGDPLGAEFQVSSYTSANRNHASVAVDRAGSFVVVWEVDQKDGDSFGVFGQKLDSAGSAVGGEFRVNTTTTSSEQYPSVSASGVDGFVVTWTVFAPVDGSATAVYAQRYCAPLSAVTVSLSGTNTLCMTTDGGIATVADVGGGGSSHQWVYRTTTTGPFPLLGATGRSYATHGPDFGGPGVFYLSCYTTPQCGSTTVSSNEIMLFVASDSAGPTVSAPAASTMTQSLCQ